jgi:hypothetical protein
MLFATPYFKLPVFSIFQFGNKRKREKIQTKNIPIKNSYELPQRAAAQQEDLQQQYLLLHDQLHAVQLQLSRFLAT